MPELENTCPRCGAGFHCGFDDAEPCACASVQLDQDTRAALRQRYTSCLCITCLRAIASTQVPITTLG